MFQCGLNEWQERGGDGSEENVNGKSLPWIEDVMKEDNQGIWMHCCVHVMARWEVCCEWWNGCVLSVLPGHNLNIFLVSSWACWSERPFNFYGFYSYLQEMCANRLRLRGTGHWGAWEIGKDQAKARMGQENWPYNEWKCAPDWCRFSNQTEVR
jgi:hypothetical protein